MKITDARVIVTCPGRNFVTLKIETDAGLTGIGDATLNGRELAVASYLTDHVIPALIGRDAHRIEDIWQYLYRGAYWRRGPVTMSAIAAVDTALWDIKAKAAGLPLYQLLGGRSRDGVMVYGHANGNDIAETLDEVARYVDMGYKAIRAQCGIPGLAVDLRRGEGQDVLRAGRCGDPDRKPLVDAEIPRPRAEAVRRHPRAVRLRSPSPARRPPPPDADRGRPARQVARAVSPVLDGGPDAGREPGGVPPDPPAHGHADRGRRGLQHDLRLPAADRASS